MYDPIKTWNSLPFNRAEKLVAVILASFFEARVLSKRKTDLSLLRQESEQDDEQDAKLVKAVLRPFGLRVTEDAVKFPSMRRFLMPAATAESISQNDVEGEVAEYNTGSWGYPMTVDYSRYLTALSSFDRDNYIPGLDCLLRLRNDFKEFDDSWIYHADDINDVVAAEEDNEHEPDSTGNGMTVNGASAVVTAVSSSVDSAEESGDYDSDEYSIYSWLGYRSHVEVAFEFLILHYNFDCITSFTFRISEATSYLALAPKMAKLQRLCLSREKTISDIHVNNTVLFIQQNQAAFPRKPRLDLKLSYGWHILDDNGDDGESSHNFPAPDLAVVEGRQLSRIRKQRERFFHYMKCVITLYEAVGRPRAIFVGKLPLFYEHSQGIDLDGLLDFDDTEMDRIDHGEGPAMGAFFRRCKSLRELKLRVDSHTLFSWAAAAEVMHVTRSNPGTLGIPTSWPDAAATPSIRPISPIHRHQHQASSMGILRHLQTLELYTKYPYRFGIHALNDAMAAFADSLRNVKLHCTQAYRRHRIDTIEDVVLHGDPLLMRRSRRSLRLCTVPWANTIGDWPRPLPQLQTLIIYFSGVASVDIGSLDQCHSLRELDIRYGDVKQHDLRPGNIDVVIGTAQEETELPSDIESVRQLMDIRYQQADLNFALFPKWNLPRLRVLVLGGLPALRFDFESLETMPSLVDLQLTVGKKMTGLQMVHDSQGMQNTAWDQKQARRRNTIFKRWNLPALKTVTIEGPPATMFYLEWLKCCPSLENLTLGYTGKHRYLQRRPFFQESEAEQQGSSYIDNYHGHDDGSEMDKSIGGDGDYDDGSGDNDVDNTPFWGSRLIRLELCGPWIMSEEDLITLLTIYAPFLESFHVDRLTDNRSLNGYSFLRAFQRVNEIHAEYATGCRELVEAETSSGTMAAKPDNGMDTRIPGQALTSVKANYTIGKRDRQALELVSVEPEEAVVFNNRGVRVYKLTNQFLVRRADRDRLDLEIGEGARARRD
ncbi:hypothetical protein BGZ98_002900 [Dissophora globulifera]|nr:hypothetical protein BGZ98_002900 [Dissophora globulifera]